MRALFQLTCLLAFSASAQLNIQRTADVALLNLHASAGGSSLVNPTNIADTKFWFVGDDFTTNVLVLDSWPDRVGGFTAGGAFQVVSGVAVNGHRAVSFSGNVLQKMTASPTPSFTLPFTMALCFSITNISDVQTVYQIADEDVAKAPSLQMQRSNSRYLAWNLPVFTASNWALTNQFMLVVISYAANGTTTMTINGQSQSGSDSPFTPDRLVIAMDKFNNSPFRGQILEVIGWNTNAAASHITAYSNWLNATYNQTFP